MKRSIAIVAVLVGLAAYVGLKVFPSPLVSTKEKSAIQAAYNQQNQAYARKDIPAILVVNSPNYEEINGKDTSGLNEYKKTLEQLFSYAHTVQATTQVQSARRHGNEVRVSAKRHIVMFFNDRHNKPATFDVNELLLDDWVQDNAKWLKRRSAVASSATTVNGTPLPDSSK